MKNIISKEEAVKKLEKNGCKLMGKSTIVLATSSCGTRQLEVAHVGSISENKRRYTVYERDINTGETFGLLEKSYMLAADEMKDGEKIQHILLGMYGKYMGNMNSILGSMQNIEDSRVLDIGNDIDCEKKTPYEIINELKGWMLTQPNDNTIVQVEINKQIELGFYPGEKRFDRLFKWIAPDNDLKLFKNCCKREGLFKTNEERSRYTYKIEKGKADRERLRTNQIYILNLDNDREFVERFLVAKEEDLKQIMTKVEKWL